MFVIIPAKPFDQAKSRLAPILSADQRHRLSRNLLLRTIRLALPLGQVVVISRDRKIRHLAKQAGAWALVEAGQSLNPALHQALAWVSARGGAAALLLPADLPLLTEADLVTLTQLSRPAPSMVIAPCHRASGTNALLLRPPRLVELNFGPNSFARHQQDGRAVGVEPVIYHSPTVAFDLDLPEDLEKLYPQWAKFLL